MKPGILAGSADRAARFFVAASPLPRRPRSRPDLDPLRRSSSTPDQGPRGYE